LADSIVKGIADRLGRVEREWFYLHLNLRRRDPESIRSWITERAFAYIWKKLVPWIWTSITGIGVCIMAGIVGWVGFGNSQTISLVV